MSVAAKRGFSWLPTATDGARVILTSHNRPVAVVDNAERMDEDLRKMQDAAWSVLDWAANLTSERAASFDLEQVCSKLGLDAKMVREHSVTTENQV